MLSVCNCRGNASVWPCRFNGHVCRCAPNRGVSHKIEVAQNWKNEISLRQDQVALSSVVQSAQLKNWYTLGNWLQVFHEIRIAKTYEKRCLNKAEAVS